MFAVKFSVFECVFVVFSACLACGLGVSVDLFFCLGLCVVLCLGLFC